MRKTIIKIIITVVSLVVFMMFLPLLAIKFADGWAVTGLWMFAFFTVNPALVIGLSIMAGTELRSIDYCHTDLHFARPGGCLPLQVT